MTHSSPYKHSLILALILIGGLGLGLVLPWLANMQGVAAVKEYSPEAITRYYVATTGDSSDPTLGWSTAYFKLQDALAVVTSGDEIRVATGVYTPGTARTDSFNLVPGAALYGGFAGTETIRTQRDWAANPTILSGDIGGDDTTNADGIVTDTANINGRNSYHVVLADGTAGTPITGTTTLDGFTISAGHANFDSPHHWGGGFYCDGHNASECSPSLINVNFSGNMANFGGAMLNYGSYGRSNPSLREVTFSGNYAVFVGGAMYNLGYRGRSSPSLRDVTFSGNSAGSSAGAMINAGAQGTSSPSLINVIFSGNAAGLDGGAMTNNGICGGSSNPRLINVTFSGNSAEFGGGMVNILSSPDVRNSVLWNNQDNSGTGTITATITNDSLSVITLTHSLVQSTGASGGSWTADASYVDGGGNIDEDPLFITPISPTTVPSTAGNLRLGSGSPAIDAGDNDSVVDVLTDLDGEARKKDGVGDGIATVDMDAYEAAVLYLLAVEKAGTGGGLVSSSPAGIDCGETCGFLLKEDSSISLMAAADGDSRFTGWSGACSGSGDCELTMDDAKIVSAIFESALKVTLPLIFR